jgi:hypothetical protein
VELRRERGMEGVGRRTREGEEEWSGVVLVPQIA